MFLSRCLVSVLHKVNGFYGELTSLLLFTAHNPEVKVYWSRLRRRRERKRQGEQQRSERDEGITIGTDTEDEKKRDSTTPPSPTRSKQYLAFIFAL